MILDIGTVKILPIDRPNWNGRLYSQSVVESAIANCRHTVLGYMNFDYMCDLEKVSHTTENLRIEDGWLVGEAKVLGTQNGKILKEIYEKNADIVKFAIAGHGNVSGDGVVTDFVLSSVNACEGEWND